MPTLHTDFHTEIAKNLVDDIQFRRSRYYYFLGKIAPWNDVEEFDPGTAQTQLAKETLLADMLFVKSIEPNQVSLTCHRYVWEPDLVFEKWDHTKEMKGEMFYTLNSEFRVYKCLDNAGGAISVEEPIGNSLYPFRTSDGYLWKYMYEIPVFKREKFSSPNDMPVQRALADTFYNRGSVDNVTVLSEGSGYADVQNTFINVTGGTTTGAGATAEITAIGVNGELVAFNITDPGADYFRGVRIEIQTADGIGAELTPIIDGTTGEILDFDIVSSGYNYEIGDTFLLTVGGGVFIPHVSRVTGSIEDVSIIDPGYGYTVAPTFTVVGTTADPGDGKYDGNSAAILIPILGDEGSIESVAIHDPGVDYPVDTSTTITVQGDGTDADFSPVVYDGSVIGVIVENRGINYTNILLHVVGTGTGAEISADIGVSDLISDQSVVEQTTIDGGIHAIEVVDKGTGYDVGVTLTVIGDGEGCLATPILDGQGRIIRVQVTNPGYNYSYAEVFLESETGFGANFYTILPPRGGHGYNAPVELLGDGVVISTSLRNELQQIPVVQDFRQFGIIKAPTDLYTDMLFVKDFELVSFKTRFNHVDNLIKDEILLINNYRFKVVDYDTATNEVWLQSKSIAHITPVGTFYADTDLLREYQSEELLEIPTMNKFSGSLLYSSNEAPFMFLEEQGVTLRTFIKF